MSMNISAQKGSVTEENADVLVVPHFAEAKGFTGALKRLDVAMGGYLSTMVEEEGFEGKPGQTVLVHTHDMLPANRVLLIGVGKKSELTLESVRRMFGTAITVARTVQADRLVASVEGLGSSKRTLTQLGQVFAEGVSLASYAFSKYKGKEEQKRIQAQVVHEAVLLADDVAEARSFQKGIDRGVVYASGTTYVRDLVNEPAIVVTPKYFAKQAEALAKIPGVSVKIYREADLKRMKMGGILGVAAGSDEEPYMVHLTYKPKAKSKKSIAFCGKGITFDSGGLSLKPAQYMEGMKQDMAGAAAILGMFTQIAEVKPSVTVHGVMMLTENMPSGKATRPGDVLTAYNGKTIEVSNTDAEGRLVLADGLSWAEKELKPDYLVDLATLTGAAIVALGQEVAAYMGTDANLLKSVRSAADAAGESLWELPLIGEYAQMLKSEIADVNNIAKTPWAGTIMGGLFLQHFVEKTPWVHIDIAGPAFVEHQVLPYAPKGGSGFGVRTLLELVSTLR